MEEISERQGEILEFLRDHDRENGQPPTRVEICEAFGFRSPNAAEKHLRALAAAGYLELLPGRSRNIRLLDRAAERIASRFELPLIGRIAAGTPVIASQNIERWTRIDPGFFHPAATFLHLVVGDSMIDAGIQPGDYVGIHAQPEAESGQIVAAVLPDPQTGDDQITLKQLRRLSGRILLLSLNQRRAYPPIEVELPPGSDYSQEGSGFRIAGVYVGLVRTRLGASPP